MISADLPHAAVRMLEPKRCKVKRVDEAVDRADRVVQPNIVLDPRREQAGLLAAIAALECTIRHKPKRTLKSPKCPSFLPSLDGRNSKSYVKTFQ